jgi:hypothetical protein
MSRIAIGLLILVTIVVSGVAQTPSPTARGVLRLRARVKVGEATRGLARKRFFLIKGSLDQNKSLVETIEQRPAISRDCYYRSLGVSDAFLKWLNESDCESVYCREVGDQDVEGPSAVPEFMKTMTLGEKEFGTRQLARKWLTVNLPEPIRNGFYRKRQSDLKATISQAETASGARVLSVMTDRNGTAYFTELEPGNYTLSNIVPAEIGTASAFWNCDIQVKPGDLTTEKPYLISNRKDRNVKCVAIEKPLPPCAPASR